MRIKSLRISWQTVVTLAVFLVPFSAFAVSGSGACSWHGGVNCSAGADWWDGSVICNDGWSDSSVAYSSVCSNTVARCVTPILSGCEDRFDLGMLKVKIAGLGGYGGGSASGLSLIKQCEDQVSANQKLLDAYSACLSNQSSSSISPIVIPKVRDYETICREEFGNYAYAPPDKPGYCQCIENYIWTTDRTSCVAKAICVNATVNAQNQCVCKEGDTLRGNACISYTEDCIRDHGTHSIGSAGPNGESFCSCAEGYQWDGGKILCVEIPKFIEESDVTPSQVEISSLIDTKVTNEYDSALTNRMSGRILLQVEDAGKAWYVNDDGRRYYMKDGTAAYGMMRSFGLGITDIDLSKIPVVNSSEEMNESSSVCSSNSMGERLKGKILLQVEQLGEAWYVDPDKCRRIYLRDGDAAYGIMRFLSLGISNADINTIRIGN